jgi:hypothetical protein
VEEWEEEIAQLKTILDNTNQEQRNQILNLELIWNQRVKTLESEKTELEKRNSGLELKLASERGNIPPIGRQTDLEKMWQKSMLREPCPRTMSMSTFTPHIPFQHRPGGQGPVSFPRELIDNAQKEVRRLQELRR